MALITNNISGSGNPNSRIGITGSLVIGDTSSFNNLSIGSDTVFFVSGTRGGRNATGTAVFGGDLIISGAVAAQDGIGGFSPIKLNTDVGLTGSLRLTKQDPTPASSTNEVVIFASGTGGVTKLYYGVGGSANEVAVAGGGAVGSAGQIQFSNGTGGFSASSDLLWDTTTSTLKAANLFITGSTTIVSSTNFVVTDPVVMVGSGAVGTKQPSLLAFANGSGVSNDDLIVGASNGLIKVATYNTTGGLLPVGSLPAAFNTLASMQLDNIFLGTTGFAGIKNEDAGASINVSGSSTGGVGFTVGSNQKVKFLSDATNYLNIRYDSGPNQTVFDGQSRKMLMTGSQVVLQTSGTFGAEGVAFIQNIGATTTQYLTITSGNVGANITSPGNVNLSAGGSQGDINVTAQGGSVRIQVKDTTQALSIQSGGGGNFLQIASGSIGPFNNVSKIGTFTGKDLVLQTVDAGKKIAFADTNTYAYAFSGSLNGTTAVPNAAIIQAEVNQALVLSGATAVIIGAGSSGGAAGYVAFAGTSGGRAGFFPAQDKANQEFDLGGPNKRWANIYTGDLHLRNERGDYTLIEEADCLTIRFNSTGKRYKFLLEPVPELDEK